jgi:S1-C subfamily serine protease
MRFAGCSAPTFPKEETTLRQIWLAPLGLCAFLGLLGPLQAQTAPDIIAHGKNATGLLEVASSDASQTAEGTAFCVDASGYFVTNQHVVDGAAADGLTLLMHPGEPGQKTFTAHIIRTDKDADLALLKVDGAAGLDALPLGRDDALSETDPVTAFGYPFGKDLALSEKEEPAVSVSVGRITSLRRDADGLEYIQVDASLNPGNSGGPVLDAKGQVVGVVQEGVPGASLNFVIPVHRVLKFLHTPAITLSPSTLTPGAEAKAQDFQIDVIPFFPHSEPFTVELALGMPGQALRTFPAKADGPVTYRVSTPPVDPSASPRQLKLTAESSGGTMVAQVADREFTLSGKPITLSQVLAISWSGDTATVDFVGGAQMSGRISGLRLVDAKVGGVAQVINFDRYSRISVEAVSSAPGAIDYHVTVRQKDIVVGDLAGQLPLGVSQTAQGGDKSPSAAQAASQGVLIVAADCWPTSDTGYDQAPTGSTGQFVRNVLKIFSPKPGHHANFLVYSTHWAFRDPFRQTLEDDGDTVTESMHPGPLEQYDGVFVGGNSDVNREALVAYLAHGGKVYVAAATGDIQPDEKRFWNSFLFLYGLEVDAGPKIDDRMDVTTFAPVTLFKDVQGLLVRGPYDIKMRPGNWPGTKIVSTQDGTGYWAIVTLPPAPDAKSP